MAACGFLRSPNFDAGVRPLLLWGPASNQGNQPGGACQRDRERTADSHRSPSFDARAVHPGSLGSLQNDKGGRPSAFPYCLCIPELQICLSLMGESITVVLRNTLSHIETESSTARRLRYRSVSHD